MEQTTLIESYIENLYIKEELQYLDEGMSVRITLVCDDFMVDDKNAKFYFHVWKHCMTDETFLEIGYGNDSHTQVRLSKDESEWLIKMFKLKKYSLGDEDISVSTRQRYDTEVKKLLTAIRPTVEAPRVVAPRITRETGALI